MCAPTNEGDAVPLPTTPLLEIAVQDVESGHVAREHGADRFELCQALGVGGLTPSRGLMEHAATLGVPFRPLIRPRAGGFQYTDAEVARSEEHTSELQSRGHLVCRHLLEKKKTPEHIV